jgi:sugar/nucleoside kinase (ribokinase family)
VAGKVLVVGSSNIDLIMKMARLPRRGETVTDATFVRAFGGKGANQAVGAAPGETWPSWAAWATTATPTR